MAVMTVLLAVVTLLGHRSHTESALSQTRAGDQWARYQAKATRRHTCEAFADLTSTLGTKDSAKSEQAPEKVAQQAERSADEQQEIQDHARDFEKEVDIGERKADRFDLGEVFREVALVITSITLLTSNRSYWIMGLLFGALGVIVALPASSSISLRHELVFVTSPLGRHLSGPVRQRRQNEGQIESHVQTVATASLRQRRPDFSPAIHRRLQGQIPSSPIGTG